MFSSNTRNIQILQIVAFLGSIVAFYFYGLAVESLLLIVFGYFLYGCLGIVVTFHRNLTHQSFKMHPFLLKIFTLLGCFSGTGSPTSWVAIHINHHLNSDKPTDPHSPLHKGIEIFSLNYEQNISVSTKWKMRNLITDKFQQIVHRYYVVIFLSYSLLLFLIGGLFLTAFLHWVPAVVTALMSNVVNYVGHKPSWVGGYRTYKLSDQSTNNWIWAIPSWGESWHNNHHRYPKDYTFRKKWWELDISALVIGLIKIK
jgi:fatty-acid desaturase